MVNKLFKKLLTQEEILRFSDTHVDEQVVFTNGCFDILHAGHVDYLQKAANMGDVLIVGLNSDSSVRRLKGGSRPINNQEDRAKVLCALSFVDYVAVFDDDTPLRLIKTIRPNILVKGGDYKPEEVVGREEVEARGGRLELLPFVDGRSTTNAVETLKTMQDELIKIRIEDSISVKQHLLTNNSLIATVSALADRIRECFKAEGKIVLCGNGGSASNALHFAGEIIGRFQKERSAWPALVLNSDVATMTVIANDYGYDEIFARQAEAHIRTDDIFIGISTSGNSENVLKAVETAKKKGAITAGLLGRDGGKISKVVDFPIIVPSDVTARVQEAHICLIHALCELVETPLVMLADLS